MDNTLVSLESIRMSGHAAINEDQLQQFIFDNPSALGLGDLVGIGRERPQKGGGKLDILLSDADDIERFAVEIQLGKTDPSHILRAIEYWDLERKKYPAQDHIAVLVAEEITYRFFNLISLFGNSIPIIAIQVSAADLGNEIGLVFSKVLDTTDEYYSQNAEQPELIVDRDYWINRGSKHSVEMADRVFDYLRQFVPTAEPNYNKHYIGVRIHSQSRNFVVCKPRKSYLVVEFGIPQSDEIDDYLEKSEFKTIEYVAKWSFYRAQFYPGDVENFADDLRYLSKKAYVNMLGPLEDMATDSA